MKKFSFFSAIVMLLCCVSCSKDDNGTSKDGQLSAQEQKQVLREVGNELNSITTQADFQKAAAVGQYYESSLAEYNTAEIKSHCGGVLPLVNKIFATLPSAKKTILIDWSINIQSAVFCANDETHKWEVVGEGNGDGIYLQFKDNEGHDCYLRIVVAKEHTGFFKGSREAKAELYCQDKLVAYCNVVCVADGITDVSIQVEAGYGAVNNYTALTSKSGEYSLVESVKYNDRNIASCTVKAGGVAFNATDNVVSTFKHVNVEADVLNRLRVIANVETSIPDLFLTSISKDYTTKLQEYLDKHVEVMVYYSGCGDTPQAEIRLVVKKTGAPLFGKVTVVPYIHFLSDDTECEMSVYFSSESCLADFLRHLEEMMVNVEIEC